VVYYSGMVDCLLVVGVGVTVVDHRRRLVSLTTVTSSLSCLRCYIVTTDAITISASSSLSLLFPPCHRCCGRVVASSFLHHCVRCRRWRSRHHHRVVVVMLSPSLSPFHCLRRRCRHCVIAVVTALSLSHQHLFAVMSPPGRRQRSRHHHRIAIVTSPPSLSPFWQFLQSPPCHRWRRWRCRLSCCCRCQPSCCCQPPCRWLLLCVVVRVVVVIIISAVNVVVVVIVVVVVVVVGGGGGWRWQRCCCCCCCWWWYYKLLFVVLVVVVVFHHSRLAAFSVDIRSYDMTSWWGQRQKLAWNLWAGRYCRTHFIYFFPLSPALASRSKIFGSRGKVWLWIF